MSVAGCPATLAGGFNGRKSHLGGNWRGGGCARGMVCGKRYHEFGGIIKSGRRWFAFIVSILILKYGDCRGSKRGKSLSVSRDRGPHEPRFGREWCCWKRASFRKWRSLVSVKCTD